MLLWSVNTGSQQTAPSTGKIICRFAAGQLNPPATENQSGPASVGHIMRLVCSAAAFALLACPIAGFAETRIPCSQTITRSLQPRTALMIDSTPAGLEIVGTDREELHVSCTAGDNQDADHIALHLSSAPNGNKLSIEGAHSDHGNHGIQIKIEVPRRTNLSVRMFAGQVTIEEVKGDKDIEIGAGQITIRSIHAGDYRRVKASVGAGEVLAQAFGADQGGLFRTFSKDNPSGDYRLQAHVTTGQIQLLGNAEQKGNVAKPD
jgi:hypothetical protein